MITGEARAPAECLPLSCTCRLNCSDGEAGFIPFHSGIRAAAPVPTRKYLLPPPQSSCRVFGAPAGSLRSCRLPRAPAQTGSSFVCAVAAVWPALPVSDWSRPGSFQSGCSCSNCAAAFVMNTEAGSGHRHVRYFHTGVQITIYYSILEYSITIYYNIL